MEADWEFELGGDAPVIDALWAGFVDLRVTPGLAASLVEVNGFPALSKTLERLNARSSPVWTSKCDFWPQLDTEDFDPDEMDALSGEDLFAVGCYIDLLPRSQQQWSQPPLAAGCCKYLCARMLAIPLRCCRADLIVRRAFVSPDEEDLGITAYVTACGATSSDAKLVLEGALALFADAILADSTVQ